MGKQVTSARIIPNIKSKPKVVLRNGHEDRLHNGLVGAAREEDAPHLSADSAEENRQRRELYQINRYCCIDELQVLNRDIWVTIKTLCKMGSNLSQVWPPAPRFTEKHVGDQNGKVFIVTGASAGVGRELARLLFSLNAKVYLVGRSELRVLAAISQIRDKVPVSTGDLHFLLVDLEDLASVKQAAANFLGRESRLDGLWNNAGVMLPPAGSVTKQGHELQLGVHCLAHFLFTQLLTPLMTQTARGKKPGEVRVMWVASSAAELFSPPGGGVAMDNLDYKKEVSNSTKYAISKAGMILLSQEYAKKHRDDGIISVAMNPGNLKSDLRRHLSGGLATVFGWISWEPVYGAYTELYAAFSTDITMENSGCWVIPWGRITAVRQDIGRAGLDEGQEGGGIGEQFWKWCENEVSAYME